MKFKFNGDVYQVHPIAIKVMQVVLGFIVACVIGIAGSYGMMSFAIATIIILFVIAVVFSDGNIQ